MDPTNPVLWLTQSENILGGFLDWVFTEAPPTLAATPTTAVGFLGSAFGLITAYSTLLGVCQYIHDSPGLSDQAILSYLTFGLVPYPGGRNAGGSGNVPDAVHSAGLQGAGVLAGYLSYGTPMARIERSRQGLRKLHQRYNSFTL